MKIKTFRILGYTIDATYSVNIFRYVSSRQWDEVTSVDVPRIDEITNKNNRDNVFINDTYIIRNSANHVVAEFSSIEDAVEHAQSFMKEPENDAELWAQFQLAQPYIIYHFGRASKSINARGEAATFSIPFGFKNAIEYYLGHEQIPHRLTETGIEIMPKTN